LEAVIRNTNAQIFVVHEDDRGGPTVGLTLGDNLMVELGVFGGWVFVENETDGEKKKKGHSHVRMAQKKKEETDGGRSEGKFFFFFFFSLSWTGILISL
jgi:hypothetical protein